MIYLTNRSVPHGDITVVVVNTGVGPGDWCGLQDGVGCCNDLYLTAPALARSDTAR